MSKNWYEQLGEGLRRDHVVACKSSQDQKPRRECGCRYSFWVMDRSKKNGQRRASLDGSLSIAQAKREKQRLALEARKRAAEVLPVALTAHAGALLPTLFEWSLTCFSSIWADKGPGTLATREQAYRLYIHGHLAEHSLDEITGSVVREWFRTIESGERGRCRATELAGETLRALMKAAVTDELIERNPVTHIPRVTRREVRDRQRWLNDGQYKQLVESCIDISDRVLVRIATECCLRRGELAALRWGDIDLDTCRITVSRAIKKGILGVKVEGGRKAGGIAYPAIGKDLEREIRRLRDRAFANEATDASPVWPGRGKRGEPWQPDTHMIADAMGRRLTRIVRNAGLVDDEGNPVVSAHGLRRTGASMAAMAGVPEIIVQHQLGHATAATTREFYIRRTDEAQQDRFAGVFG